LCDSQPHKVEEVVSPALINHFKWSACQKKSKKVLSVEGSGAEDGLQSAVQSDYIFSIGPVTALRTFQTSVSSIVNPEPSCIADSQLVANESIFDVHSVEPVDSSGLQPYRARPWDREVLFGDPPMLFFRILDAKPDYIVPSGAPKLQQSSGLIVAACIGEEISESGKKAKVLLEGPEGKSHDDFSVLNMNAFDVQELLTVQRWKQDTQDLNVSVRDLLMPKHLEVCLKDVLQGLLRASLTVGEEGGSYCYVQASDPTGGRMEALKELEKHRYISRDVNAGADEWKLCPEGVNLDICCELSEPSLVLSESCLNVEPAEMCIFQLLVLLASEGWVCNVKAEGQRSESKKKKKKKKTKGGHEETDEYIEKHKVAYIDGGDKNWWIKSGQTSVFHSYLLSLVTAKVHSKPVEHFKTNKYYECLLSGKEHVIKKRGTNKSGFLFMDTAALLKRVSEKTEQKQTKRKPKSKLKAAKKTGEARPKSKRLKKKISLEPDSEDGGDGGDEGDGGVLHEDDKDIKSEHRSDSESESRSASSTSEESSSAEDDSDADDDEPPPVEPKPKPCSPCALPPSNVDPVREDDSNLLAEGISQYWEGFRFQPKFRGIDQVGWDAYCRHKDHKDPTNCVKSASFKKHGGRKNCEHKLKWWCLQAVEKKDGAEHVHKTDFPRTIEELPPLSELENTMLDLNKFRQ